MKGKIFEGIAFAQDIRAMKPFQQRHKRQTFEGIANARFPRDAWSAFNAAKIVKTSVTFARYVINK